MVSRSERRRRLAEALAKDTARRMEENAEAAKIEQKKREKEAADRIKAFQQAGGKKHG